MLSGLAMHTLQAFRQRVNLRTVFYLGPGWDGSRFRAGDIIPQPGHCSALPSCRRLDPGALTDI